MRQRDNGLKNCPMSYGPTKPPLDLRQENPPFKLAYRLEALILVEIGLPSFQMQHFDEILNAEGLHLNSDLLDETRHITLFRLHFNSKVKPRVFQKGDLVLREVEASNPQDQGKLMPS